MKISSKYLIIFLALTSTSLFANYTYGGNNMGKIDMHGGKEQKLVPGQMNLNNLNGLNNLSINKPTTPTKPAVNELIKKEEKKKETNE